MLFVTSGNFCFISLFTANCLTFIADRIARVLKTSGTTQPAVLNISRAIVLLTPEVLSTTEMCQKISSRTS